ncbi:MAG: MotA/TolQ/ExbB proton channel family protein [Eubacterium sp.]|nr:MotA/TolQ/ExbB proton channel family protein [Eubacterium sp.]
MGNNTEEEKAVMDMMLELISKYGVLTINVLGIIVCVCIFINYSNLKSQRDKISDVLEGKRIRKKLNKRTHEMEVEEIEKKATPEEMRERREAFNRVCSWDQVISQLVPLFPLFGILGTVAGLMQQLRTQELDAIMESLNTALGTTLWGLIWAIILKTMVAFLSSRVIYEAEVMLEGYDKEFSDTIALRNITED